MIRSLIIALIRGYQRFISPVLPPACRYRPTCSQYTIDAVRHHGAVVGVWMGFWRTMRCHPLFPGGYDPVVPPGAPAPLEPTAPTWATVWRSLVRRWRRLRSR